MSATGQTVPVLRYSAEDAEADAADEADGYDVAVAETGGAEINGNGGG